MEISIRYDHRADDLKPLPLEAFSTYVLTEEGVPFNTEVSISFVDDATIAGLNERYRGKEGPTDVLSFPCDSPFEDLSASLLAQTPTLTLGDVVIAPDVADGQRHAYGTTFEEEILVLLLHGLLHLCEYDHIDDRDAEKMEARERSLLKGWRASVDPLSARAGEHS